LLNRNDYLYQNFFLVYIALPNKTRSKLRFITVFHLYEGIDSGKAEKSEHFEFAEFLLRIFVNECNST
ncbi:hypothetical protein, partial [Sutterella wadsworthensis]|uniref:hypothetical protein n=1 Tax=Sutterella wadsworthensis TaxID=40545 RepID=UPI003FEDDDC1